MKGKIMQVYSLFGRKIQSSIVQKMLILIGDCVD